MTTTTTTTVKCERCHRPLTDPKRAALGIGRHCARIRRQEAATLAFKPAQVEKARELIEQRAIVPLRGRRVFAVIASNGVDRYLTAPHACNCPAGLKAKHTCYHRVAAVLLAA
ncbi:hypothetical protein EDD29_0078 [Actinocorallia herbida]|uniref:SWIM-type domain-containing protein n=1 Tax=Actinocorallia herbida TaxID=58109 RepID=A0A3N1CMQ4_9ACTN|nr:DUF6011 domain-containing protein [Actinocorallia herbida]ROO82597.1 hypothetical protein EDD29_0078 [Actinocorallia herbida]